MFSILGVLSFQKCYIKQNTACSILGLFFLHVAKFPKMCQVVA